MSERPASPPPPEPSRLSSAPLGYALWKFAPGVATPVLLTKEMEGRRPPEREYLARVIIVLGLEALSVPSLTFPSQMRVSGRDLLCFWGDHLPLSDDVIYAAECAGVTRGVPSLHDPRRQDDSLDIDPEERAWLEGGPGPVCFWPLDFTPITKVDMPFALWRHARGDAALVYLLSVDLNSVHGRNQDIRYQAAVLTQDRRGSHIRLASVRAGDVIARFSKMPEPDALAGSLAEATARLSTPGRVGWSGQFIAASEEDRPPQRSAAPPAAPDPDAGHHTGGRVGLSEPTIVLWPDGDLPRSAFIHPFMLWRHAPGRAALVWAKDKAPAGPGAQPDATHFLGFLLTPEGNGHYTHPLLIDAQDCLATWRDPPAREAVDLACGYRLLTFAPPAFFADSFGTSYDLSRPAEPPQVRAARRADDDAGNGGAS